MIRNRHARFLAGTLIAWAVSAPAGARNYDPAAEVDHAPFDTLLARYVAPDGVRYAAWAASERDRTALREYVAALAAARPETEARLTAAAEALMEGLTENAVDFRPNYDGTLEEPVVMPAAFPNLLANGSSGIAVGMATNIPPHNLDELLEACIHLAKTKNSELVRDETLFEIVKGPDFPTGGVIVEPRESLRTPPR
jgi:hypothetical protein